MFYKQFLTITDLLNPEFVENFDIGLPHCREVIKKTLLPLRCRRDWE